MRWHLHVWSRVARSFFQSKCLSRHFSTEQLIPAASCWAGSESHRDICPPVVILSLGQDEGFGLGVGGSWPEIRGWRYCMVPLGSSSAGAAQSHSWPLCTWHKTHWLCRESGALRQKRNEAIKCSIYIIPSILTTAQKLKGWWSRLLVATAHTSHFPHCRTIKGFISTSFSCSTLWDL